MSDTSSNISLTEEEIAEHILAMGHSVELIASEITKDWNDERGQTVKRNCDHLEFMLGRDYMSFPVKLQKSFTDAVDAGRAYLTSNQ